MTRLARRLALLLDPPDYLGLRDPKAPKPTRIIVIDWGIPTRPEALGVDDEPDGAPPRSA